MCLRDVSRPDTTDTRAAKGVDGAKITLLWDCTNFHDVFLVERRKQQTRGWCCCPPRCRTTLSPPGEAGGGRRADGCLVASATSCCCGRPAPCGARYTRTFFDKNRKKSKNGAECRSPPAFSARLTPPRRRTSATVLHLATLCSLVQAVKGVGDTAVGCDCRHLNGAARRACRKMNRVILKIALVIWDFF